MTNHTHHRERFSHMIDIVTHERQPESLQAILLDHMRTERLAAEADASAEQMIATLPVHLRPQARQRIDADRRALALSAERHASAQRRGLRSC